MFLKIKLVDDFTIYVGMEILQAKKALVTSWKNLNFMYERMGVTTLYSKFICPNSKGLKVQAWWCNLNVLYVNYISSQKHLRIKVTQDLHLTYSKNGGNLWLVLNNKKW